MTRRPRLRLVGSSDPSEVFSDLAKLRREQEAPQEPQRRSRAAETFARIPHDKVFGLYQHRIGSPAWLVLIELDRLILKRRGQNPVRLESRRLRAAGIVSRKRMIALHQLAAGGVIRIERRKSGLSPWITHLWYPVQER
jgi:hypothetical protein